MSADPASVEHGAVRRVTRVDASYRLLDFALRELWSYRELLLFFVWRDIKVRYKQTALGGAWALVQPVAQMVIFSIIFGNLAGIPSEGVPYPLFVFTGILPWTYFAGALAAVGISLVANSALMSKVYFPRLITPLTAAVTPLVDFAVASLVLAGLFVYYGTWPSWHVVAFPIFLLLAVLTALGAGLWIAGLSVRYRDVRFGLPFLIQIWLFVSPIVYPVSLVPERWRWLLSLNPMTGVLDGFRWSLLDRPAPELQVIGVSALAAVLLLGSGLLYFRRIERTFVDVI